MQAKFSFLTEQLSHTQDGRIAEDQWAGISGSHTAKKQSIKFSRAASWSKPSHFPSQLSILLANHHAAEEFIRLARSLQWKGCVCVYECLCVSVCVYMDEWMWVCVIVSRSIDRWWMGGWTDGSVCVCVLMTRWMDEHVSVCVCVCVCVCVSI